MSQTRAVSNATCSLATSFSGMLLGFKMFWLSTEEETAKMKTVGIFIIKEGKLNISLIPYACHFKIVRATKDRPQQPKTTMDGTAQQKLLITSTPNEINMPNGGGETLRFLLTVYPRTQEFFMRNGNLAGPMAIFGNR
ncbi:hypothetical protein JRQ81_019635 [Phrynocephalus forsythii]|uniref:Uncharacterized protein n=1 Tax=Phrynocephalus forsythii TaxID=171643 RepID=A0A9Q1AY57_9SAUR|nr:hypothetical protein JRQ81_019635 [Phrynocephalus forsythii]